MKVSAWNKLMADLYEIKQRTLGNMPDDPLVEHEGMWYFYDETWSVLYGPYSSRASANCGLMNYLEEM